MRNSWLVLLLFLSSSSWAQKHTFLNIAPKFFNQDFQLNTNYVGLDGVTVTFDHFMYYISDVKIIHDGGQIHNVIPSVFIAKPDTFSFYLGELSLTTIEQIQFMVGVPQRLNIQSGAEAQDISVYPASHPLSFQSPSMYWGWQAGYMHMIIGGFADNNGDGTLESYFELHNLGNNNQQLVEILNVVQTNSASDQIDVYLNCNVDRWINNIPLSTVGILHDQVGINATILDNIVTESVFTQLSSAQLFSGITQRKAYFVNHADEIEFIWHSISNLEKILVIDLNGKIVSSINTQESSGSFMTNSIPSAVYTVCMLDKQENVIGHYRVIH
jgi:hypothetical protein